MEIYWPIVAVVLAYIMDLILGDPQWLPHPVVVFGKAIAWGERRLNKGGHRILRGAFLTLVLVLSVLLIFGLTQALLLKVHSLFYALFVFIFFFFGLANRTLIREGKQVFSVLDKQGLEAGRKHLSRIVGRDTSQLNEQQIKRAVLETMAENLSDGVVAPVFWFAVGGIPAMMAYKMINTLDSMIGYKSERYLYFGRFAARLDDWGNFVPARITGVMMAAVAPSVRSLLFMIRYGRKHSSPNAGYPESALAGILDVRFGGPNVYHGVLVDKPYIGRNNRFLINNDFTITARINHSVCLFSVLAILVLILTINQSSLIIYQ